MLITDLLRTYAEAKHDHPGKMVLMEAGAFYEALYDDAYTVATVMNRKTTVGPQGVPLCGVPYHELHKAMIRLAAAGRPAVVVDLPKGGE